MPNRGVSFFLGRSNHEPNGDTSSYHVNSYTACLCASARSNRQPLILILHQRPFRSASLTPYEERLSINGIHLPAVLCSIRTEQGRNLRAEGIERFANRFLTPRSDGLCNTITSVTKDNLIMILNPDNPQ